MTVVIRAMIVAAIAFMMLVMIAAGVRIIFQASFCQGFRRHVSVTVHPGIQPDTCVRQRHLSAHANAAAYQRVCLGSLQETGQRSMTAAVGIYDLLPDDFAILHIIELELLRVSEMLEDLSVFIGDCDSHGFASFLIDVFWYGARCEFTYSADDQ